jgi:uncharacterized protein (TIGR03067 family)
MKFRSGLALLAFAGLTAFAPAPFPRPERLGHSADITLATFQGDWRIEQLQVSNFRGEYAPLKESSVTHIRITDGRWTYIPSTYQGSKLNISVNHSKTPVRITFYEEADTEKKRIYGVGLLRREGNRVQVLYCWGGESKRPRAFEPPPAGYWLMTLEREN